jgi:serine/threonine protein kinase
MYEIGRYDFPQSGHFIVWYKCNKRQHPVYLEFLDWSVDEPNARRAMKTARELEVDALLITRTGSHEGDNTEFVVCQFREFKPQFNTTLGLVDHDNLSFERYLKKNVAIVQFQNERFVYKFMDTTCLQATFETEERNYRKLADVSGIPRLNAAVSKGEVVQGLLISYIDGDDLWSVAGDSALDDSELLNITYGIIQLAAVLEERQFYHQDLKCSNIVRRRRDGKLFFVDLAGGLTKDMYRHEREYHILCNGFDAADGLFSLGRTIWSLWTRSHPQTTLSIDAIRHDTVRKIVTDCEEGRVDSIGALDGKYVPGVAAG